MDLPDSGRTLHQIARECDLYRRLLDLGEQDDLDAFLRQALALMLDVVLAQRGYLELSEERLGAEPLVWCAASGTSDDDLPRIRSAISAGIIALARAGGKTITTASARNDPRFQDRKSVKALALEAVLCAPIGQVGVLYLEGRNAPGPFAEQDRRTAETFARRITPFVELLLLKDRRRSESDPTRGYRDKLVIEGLVGASEELAMVLKQVAVAAPRDTAVLLTGPSGTGKTQIAKIIHANGPRAGGPFVEINCSAIPEGLVENELFGALPGGHGTATRKILGKIEAAHGGTLFLDEIGELPLSVQPKFLQFLQSKEYYPLGGTKRIKADARIIAATNADLEAEVAERRFREDLYYRLKGFRIRMPALKERRDDIPLLCEELCRSVCAANALPPLRLSPNARRAAAAAEWPGNVRELMSTIEVAVFNAVGEGASFVEVRHLFPDAARDGELSSAVPLTYHAATRAFQAELLRKALVDAQWNLMEAARQLDLSRSQIYTLIREFKIKKSK